MVDSKGILIFGEIRQGLLASIVTELLGIGQKLALEIGEKISVIIIGSDPDNVLANDAIAFGANEVYIVDNPSLASYKNDSYVEVMEKVCRTLNPRILLFGHTSIGRDLAPRLAFRLKTGLVTDCTDVTLDPDSHLLVLTRPVYGGNAMAVLRCGSYYPQMATVREKAMAPSGRDNSREGEIVHMDVELDSSLLRTEFIERIEQNIEGVKLEDAEIVVCGGRGIGSADGFKELEELARILGGAVGATRSPCESNWAPSTIQVGLTGKIVTPKLYIGIALSGSSQHISGCSGSRTIVAINKDQDANIFNIAHYGIVGDYKKVLPAFKEKCKEILR